MLKKENRKHLILLTVIILSAAIAVSSIITVAAASISKSNVQAETNAEDAYGEIELSNGDVLAGRNENGCLNMYALKALNVFVNYNGSSQKIRIAKGTVADALNKADVTVGENQAVTPAPDVQVTDNMVITVQDGVKVEITADGETKAVVAPIDTAENALNALGYSLGKDDILSVDRNERVKSGMKITLQRVTYKQETVTEKISYDTVTKTTDELDSGETQVEVKGADGSKEVTRQIKYIDGKKSDEKVLKEKVLKEPVNEVVLKGKEKTVQTSAGFEVSTSGENTFVDENGNTVAYSTVLTGSGTAYTAPEGAATSTGVPAYVGGVAVNPNIIPYGSRLYIVSTDGSFVYGYATAVDTGGALMDGSALVDLFYSTEEQCVNFGRRDVNVYVLS
ncbi:MAG: G5 domain-containing protein [Oscillospiraceae bacterium]|nr:G5 domain-containing protein [Oscillospiraceae bacterium]